MKGKFSKPEIADLLNKFMAGETSLDEENILAQYFRTHEVSDEWKEYKEMFAMFDSGTVEVSLNSRPPESLTPRPLQGERELKRRRLWPWVGAIAASIVLLLVFHYNNKVMPVEEQPVVAEVVEQPAQEGTKVSENSEVSENSDKSESTELIKPKRTYKPSKPVAEPLLAQAEEEPVISADKQALVDIYLAEEALQVAYELQAQQEELRAYAASLMGVEEPQPQSIIAF